MPADLREQLQASLGAAYTLERELGGGGMSRVFLATETRLRRQVVIKVVSPELAAGVSNDRFEREIQLAASLQQANIVPLLSAGETGGVPYYAMPFVEGESLRAKLSKEGRVGVHECVGILRDLARALSYAHTHGVVHRDIKPDNILLSHGAAVVTDFGIAKAISASRTQAPGGTLTQVGTSIGTPNYMAPEQVAGDADADHRLDIYAFGCVAYELMVGHPPFSDPAPQKVLAAHLTQPPPALRDLRPEVPVTLANLVMRCLEKQPTDRPQSADELLRALDAIVTPSGGYSTGVSSASRPVATWRRALVVVAAVLALGAVVLVASREMRAPAAAEDTSIAVLPLTNLSGDSTNNYFGEGLAEEITGALAKAGLHVVGRGSARALAARGLEVREIAEQLGVGTVLQGAVQRSGDQLRISVTLISASDGTVRWTAKYDRQLKDVFAVQDEIARSIVTELRAALSPLAGARLVRNETADPEAHSLYLQGLSLWNRRTGPAIRQAIGLFKQAVERDAAYARAHAAMAIALAALPYYEDADTDSLAAEVRATADRALAIDSTIPEAWTAKAFAGAYQWRNAEAARDFGRAIQLDSTFATGRFWHGLWLSHMGRFPESEVELRRARELEPTSLVMRISHFPELATRRFAAAEAAARGLIASDATFAIAYESLAMVLSLSDKHDEAVRVGAVLASLPGLRPSEAKGTYAFVLARAGRASDARAVLAALRTRSGRMPPSGVVAAAQMELGETDAALATLKDAVERHDPWILNYGPTPRYEKLRADPRGKALLESTERP